jgi:hypothetical protein
MHPKGINPHQWLLKYKSLNSHDIKTTRYNQLVTSGYKNSGGSRFESSHKLINFGVRCKVLVEFSPLLRKAANVGKNYKTPANGDNSTS